MQNVLNAFKSKRVWVIIALFAVNGLSGVRESLGPSAVAWVDPILLILGVLFGAKPVSKN